MIQFWLDNLYDLVSPGNFQFDSNKSQTYIKLLNIIALLSILVSIVLITKYKKPIYFTICVVVLATTILIKSNINYSAFSATVGNTVTSDNMNLFDTGVYLLRATGNDPSGLNNVLYVNNIFNFNKGDIIALSNENGQVTETNVVADLKSTNDASYYGENVPMIILLNPLKNNYSKYSTKILKVSDSAPNIIPPPSGNDSIRGSGNNVDTDLHSLATQNYPKFMLPNADRNDWNLELSTMIPGAPNMYQYQGQPNGKLSCRLPTVQNPMGTINPTEYDAPPTMFGTCNEGEIAPNGILINTMMTEDQEATVSQRVDDLLFHKGNSQMQFSPMPSDTLPNDQEGFANWCYRSPTNLVNPKYGSIFVNDPEKFKLVTRLARATGTEGGGAGGR